MNDRTPTTLSNSSPSTRRVFMLHALAGAGAAVWATQAEAQAALAETDAQAVALGYKADTTKVDKAKYPKHAATQLCNNCALYAGKPTDAAAACPLFPGKLVAGKGWCSAWAKKG